MEFRFILISTTDPANIVKETLEIVKMAPNSFVSFHEALEDGTGWLVSTPRIMDNEDLTKLVDQAEKDFGDLPTGAPSIIIFTEDDVQKILDAEEGEH